MDRAEESAEDFEVAATVPLIITEDIQAAADALRPFYALYFGGMGAKGAKSRALIASASFLAAEGECARYKVGSMSSSSRRFLTSW